MQVSFGSNSKVKGIKVTLDGKEVTLSGSRHPCKGIKKCGLSECSTLISTTRKQCKEHPATKPVPFCDVDCPVSIFVLEAPEERGQKWVGLVTSTSSEEHNHPDSPDFKLGKKAEMLITNHLMDNPGDTSDTPKKLATPLALSSHVGTDIEAMAGLRKKVLKSALGHTDTSGLESVNPHIFEKYHEIAKAAVKSAKENEHQNDNDNDNDNESKVEKEGGELEETMSCHRSRAESPFSAVVTCFVTWRSRKQKAAFTHQN